MFELLAAAAMGLISGTFLTLMDRIDEHRIVQRHRAFLAYLAATATAASMAWSIEQFPVLYPFLLGLCVEWIIKDKIDFPSHVFFLFLLTLYFGWRIDLLWQYAPYIVLFLAVRYVSGTMLRRKLGGKPGFFRWYYASYWEKFVCDIMLAIALSSLPIIVYAAGFTVACLYTKRLLPEKSNKLDAPCPT
ncbi:MAG: hypothetical protein Q8L93_05885 [Rhodocyclaceae bacterium]|nr:hypothetical protein [Rhodocyclaceae bacterium]